jgi:16S rRNA (cytosine1402-N4)-methyltransferase
MSDYHVPVMLRESVDELRIWPDGVYLDLTFGGGGHSKGILEKIDKGHLYAFDQDKDAESNAQEIRSRSFTFIRANFRHLSKYLRVYGISQVDGVFADLGISSHQIDEASRGFSTRSEGGLDMRMNQEGSLTAGEWINSVSETEMRLVIKKWGEVRNAGAVARAICSARANQQIETTTQLTSILEPLAPRGKHSKFFAQVFQAIRIQVNDEMSSLNDALEQGTDMLVKGGRFVVLTYHSLEDRMVKNFFRCGKVSGEVEKDIYGNMIRPLIPVHRKPIPASDEEISKNSRARSAKLRVAEKI